MANGTPGLFGGFFPAQGGGVQGLLGSPALNLGIGLLSAAGPSTQPTSIGQGLLSGLQLAQSSQGAQLRNQLIREKLAQQAQQREAFGQLRGLLEPGTLTAGGGEIEAGTGAVSQGREIEVPALGLLQAGGIQSPQVMGLLAQIAPEQFAKSMLAQSLPQEPTSLQRNFEFLTSPEVGLSQDEALQTLKPAGTTVNVGGKLDQPFSPSDLTKVRGPNGEALPIGTTPRQAAAMGAQVMTPEQQKALDASEKFGGILDRLEDLALGPGGVFTDIEPGFGNRARAALDLFIGSITRERPNIEAYESFAQGTIAPFIRQLGESGALAEGDVFRGLGLLPQIRDEFLLPDTREDARGKLDALREILERGVSNLRGQTSRERRGNVASQSRRQSGATPRLRFNPATGQLEEVR